jgi:hypothetical protein
LWTVLLTLLVPAMDHVVRRAKESFRSTGERPDYALVGEALRSAGIHQGDLLAVAGGLEYQEGAVGGRMSTAYTAYYARYMGSRVVAAIVDQDDGTGVTQRPPPEFWHVSPETLARAEKALQGIGVRAIVALDRPADSTPADWKEVRGTRYSILLLKPSS